MLFRSLHHDPTGRNLAAALPLLGEDAIVATLGWSAVFDDAFSERGDLPVVAYRTEGADPVAGLRRGGPDRPVRVLDLWDPPPGRPAVLVVETFGFGGTGALVAAGTAEIIDVLEPPEVWIVVADGRSLPDPLFERVAAASGADRMLVPTDRFSRAVGPRGAGPPDAVILRPDCPIAPELLRP